jgi:hypothetical protein
VGGEKKNKNIHVLYAGFPPAHRTQLQFVAFPLGPAGRPLDPLATHGSVGHAQLFDLRWLARQGSEANCLTIRVTTSL